MLLMLNAIHCCIKVNIQVAINNNYYYLNYLLRYLSFTFQTQINNKINEDFVSAFKFLFLFKIIIKNV